MKTRPKPQPIKSDPGVEALLRLRLPPPDDVDPVYQNCIYCETDLGGNATVCPHCFAVMGKRPDGTIYIRVPPLAASRFQYKRIILAMPPGEFARLVEAEQSLELESEETWNNVFEQRKRIDDQGRTRYDQQLEE